jgi:hypothetical protein
LWIVNTVAALENASSVTRCVPQEARHPRGLWSWQCTTSNFSPSRARPSHAAREKNKKRSALSA